MESVLSSVPVQKLFAGLDLSSTQRRFLAVFLEVCSIQRAAQHCKLSRRTHWYWMREGSNAKDYSQAFKIAEHDAADRLEAEAIKRAMDGELEPVFYKGKVVGHVTRKSDRLMEILLRAHKPEKYLDRSKVEHSGLSLPELADQIMEARKRRDAEADGV